MRKDCSTDNGFWWFKLNVRANNDVQFVIAFSSYDIFLDAMAYRGDLIGCTVNFHMAKDGKVPIVFSLNGRQITRNEIQIDYIPNEKSLYPYIGIGHEGIRVLAMV